MLKFVTSLTFLYVLTIVVLLVYGFVYYRDFEKGRYLRNRFPVAFFIISITCFGFLWINLNPPLRLQTFSNLDHHFVRHDGFVVSRSIELGRADTAVNENSYFNRFQLSRSGPVVKLNSPYSEEPFYIENGDSYQVASVNFPAVGHTISWQSGQTPATLTVKDNETFELRIGEEVYAKTFKIKRAISAWNLFRDDYNFIRSVYFNSDQVAAGLRHIFLLRDDISRKGAGELKYFLSGRLFQSAGNIRYDGTQKYPGDLGFSAELPGKSRFAWGIGFLDNNRNQYEVAADGEDTFTLYNRYPVSYPLSEETRNDWSQQRVNKFLVSDHRDMATVPPVFKEGFLFTAMGSLPADQFDPVLLSAVKAGKNDSLHLKAHGLYHLSKEIAVNNGRLMLPARSAAFAWLFSIRNTYEWDFAGFNLSSATWQLLLFGSLSFFFLLVFMSSLVKPAANQHWLWQLLSCVMMVLLTTRFFLYWRYKSFPPFEGMDLPSQQQLQSFSNFAVILFATIILALVFGFPVLRELGRVGRQKLRALSNSGTARGHYTTAGLKPEIGSLPLFRFVRQKFNKLSWFFGSWLLLLCASGAVAAVNHFDAGVCRRMAILLILFYFGYLFFSYRKSPVVSQGSDSWWEIRTNRPADLIFSNPVKVLLSLSLLVLFVFIDIGFAIVFLNFLLFNEAYLCLNYGIGGLAAGSRRNAFIFVSAGLTYLLIFMLNLLFAPYIFSSLLNMPQWNYIIGYAAVAVGMAQLVARLVKGVSPGKRVFLKAGLAASLFLVAFFCFPKKRILDKAAMTKYRIDVLTTPVDKAILTAYSEGKTYEPVIRAAQNQWFINTFIHEDNNPVAKSVGFNLLPHAPQNKGAKYNAQATDLVTSRFLIAEHGTWSVLFYVLILLLPALMLSTFFQLYPDFTNRTNHHYPAAVTGFSMFNYLLITALLVILAATGRYIFFGQDLPFGSILSKQSVLYPSLLILLSAWLLKSVPQMNYANRRKVWPGAAVLGFLAIMLFFVKPVFNKNREFAVADLVKEMDSYVQLKLQPLMDHFDTSKATRRLSLAKKDALFSDSLRRLISSGALTGDNKFFFHEVSSYAHSAFGRHLDQRKMLYLDLYSGTPRLSVNQNYFRVEAPPHLQQSWTGNVFGDSTVYNVSLWQEPGEMTTVRMNLADEPVKKLNNQLTLAFRPVQLRPGSAELYLFNSDAVSLRVRYHDKDFMFSKNDSIKLDNPSRLQITDTTDGSTRVLMSEPDAFMRNYYVNGARYYVYPMADRLVWARNFAEAVSADYSSSGQTARNAFISLDLELMDALSTMISEALDNDTAYKRGAEYGICIADGNGRLIAINDFIKQFDRPDPNDKAGFQHAISGADGFISQAMLRKKVGNLNLLRLNPGPGSTLKPIVFSAIASQMDFDWDAFAAEGFAGKQHYFGGEKVPEYDFEKSNGRIQSVADYLKYSDNYYHSNVLLLGSYPKQAPSILLTKFFARQRPGAELHWPSFSYTGRQYWLNGFENWPGYRNRKADFGTDSSFTAIGLHDNYGIDIHDNGDRFDMFNSAYDSSLFLNAKTKSGFLLPEYALFDQRGDQVDHRIPYDLFTSCFRGHVKGSSQVMVPPAKMLEAYGRLVTQSRNYKLTLNPYASATDFNAFHVDQGITYNNFLDIMRASVFKGMQEALFTGTAARLGGLLKNGSPWYYYAKTGTTGDDQAKTKSKLLAIVISAADITDPDFNFRNNKFYTIYFTSQNGPAKQNEEFQASVIKRVRESAVFNRYMHSN